MSSIYKEEELLKILRSERDVDIEFSLLRERELKIEDK